MEETDEEISQNSSKDSTSSPPEYDVGDETMASQETAATDMSHTATTTASIVRVLFLLSSRPMTKSSLACRNPSTAASCCLIQGANESDQYPHVPTPGIHRLLEEPVRYKFVADDEEITATQASSGSYSTAKCITCLPISKAM